MVGENLNQNFFFLCKNSWLNSYLIEEKNQNKWANKKHKNTSRVLN